MGRKSKFLSEIKILAVQDYLSGKRRFTQILNELEIDSKLLQQWVLKFNMHGEDGLRPILNRAIYSPELKRTAVQEYQSGSMSQMQICYKYKITNHSILQRWIKKYNSHETLNVKKTTGDEFMVIGRKTTFEERIEIVSVCIANDYDYQKTAAMYQVSYQQVYAWTKKYNEHGLDSLKDRRGRRKNIAAMTDNEQLSHKVKLLEVENKRLQLEVGFLKKLKEVERRGAGKLNTLQFKNSTKKPDSQ